MSLKDRALSYVRRNYPRLISGIELERLAMDNNYKASTISRRLRELENENKILATYSDKHFVSYQAKQEYVDSPELAPKETKEPNSLFGPPNSPKAVNPQNIICGKLK